MPLEKTNPDAPRNHRATGWFVLALGAIFLGGCALPPPPPPAPLEISGVLSDVDVDGRFFYLENAASGRRAVYWDDSTLFTQKRQKMSSKEVALFLGDNVGENVGVIAVPMGRKMVANVVDDS